MIKKFKSTEPWIYFISDLNGEEIVGRYYKKELPNDVTIQKATGVNISKFA